MKRQKVEVSLARTSTFNSESMKEPRFASITVTLERGVEVQISLEERDGVFILCILLITIRNGHIHIRHL